MPALQLLDSTVSMMHGAQKSNTRLMLVKTQLDGNCFRQLIRSCCFSDVDKLSSNDTWMTANRKVIVSSPAPCLANPRLDLRYYIKYDYWPHPGLDKHFVSESSI